MYKNIVDHFTNFEFGNLFAIIKPMKIFDFPNF